MTISWHGFNYFKLKNSSNSIILNPYSLDNKTKFGKAKGEIVLFSDNSQTKQVKLDKEVFVIDSPGEYEVNESFVYSHKINGHNIFLIVFEGVKIAFLGEFGHQELSDKDLEIVEGADILILPVGGGEMLTVKEAAKVINQVEPRIVIPSCHKAGSFKLKADPVEDFIKEFGLKPETVDKYKIQKKSLPQEEMKLVVLEFSK